MSKRDELRRGRTAQQQPPLSGEELKRRTAQGKPRLTGEDMRRRTAQSAASEENDTTASMQPTEDGLRALSAHVLYEIEMLFAAAELLERHVKRESELPWAVHMAVIESFAIHARALIDFLFRERGEGGKKTDGFAADYFDPGQWRSLCPPAETTLDPVRQQVGEQIAHISFNRAALTEEATEWPFAQIAASIGRPLRVLLQHVPESLVMEGFSDRVWRAFPPFLRHPVAISHPPPNWPPPTATQGMPPKPQQPLHEDHPRRDFA